MDGTLQQFHFLKLQGWGTRPGLDVGEFLDHTSLLN